MATKIIISIIFTLVVSIVNSQESVKGYVKKNGTYIQPHKRSDKNNTQKDNWSSKPNYNPYTGKKGTKTPKK